MPAELLYIVEGEFDVWSLHRLGIRNVIGIYGISNIPKDIAAIFDELGVAGFIYCVDNDKAGDDGASNLRTLLHRIRLDRRSRISQVRGTRHTGQQATRMTCYATTFQIFRGPARRWMRYPHFYPA